MPCRECGKFMHNRSTCEVRVMREAFSVLNDDPNSILSEREEVKRITVLRIVILLRLVQCERLDHIVVYNAHNTLAKYVRNAETGEITSSRSNFDDRTIYQELMRSRPILNEELEKYRNNPTTYTLSSIRPASDFQKREEVQRLNDAIARGRIIIEQRERARRERIELQERQQAILGQGLPQPVPPRPNRPRVQLSEKRENAIKSESCPICMDTIGETDNIVLRCGHHFCSTCVFKHTITCISRRTDCTCPICRGAYMTVECIKDSINNRNM